MKVRYKIVKRENHLELKIIVPALFRNHEGYCSGHIGFVCNPYPYPNKIMTRGRIEKIIRRNRPDMAALSGYFPGMDDMIEFDLRDDKEKFFSWSFIDGISLRVMSYELAL